MRRRGKFTGVEELRPDRGRGGMMLDKSDEGRRKRFEDLVGSIQSLRGVPGVSPWDAETLLRWMCEAERPKKQMDMARFALRVWNRFAHWSVLARELGLPQLVGGRHFELVDAVVTMDVADRELVAKWLAAPFFPRTSSGRGNGWLLGDGEGHRADRADSSQTGES